MPLVDLNTIYGQKAHMTVEQHCPLVSKISIDPERLLIWGQCHWKLYEIIFPSIQRTSKSDAVCYLDVDCGLLLDSEVDSNLILFEPPIGLDAPLLALSTSVPFFNYFLVLSMVPNYNNVFR